MPLLLQTHYNFAYNLLCLSLKGDDIYSAGSPLDMRQLPEAPGCIPWYLALGG